MKIGICVTCWIVAPGRIKEPTHPHLTGKKKWTASPGNPKGVVGGEETCFKGVTQGNSSNPIGSASKTARFGASVLVKELKKGQRLVLR